MYIYYVTANIGTRDGTGPPGLGSFGSVFRLSPGHGWGCISDRYYQQPRHSIDTLSSSFCTPLSFIYIVIAYTVIIHTNHLGFVSICVRLIPAVVVHLSSSQVVLPRRLGHVSHCVCCYVQCSWLCCRTVEWSRASVAATAAGVFPTSWSDCCCNWMTLFGLDLCFSCA